MRTVNDYLNLLVGEHRNKSKFAATVELLAAPLAATQQFLAGLPTAFNLDTAAGVQLDIDGIWIGRSRQIEVPLANVFFSFDTPNLGWDQGVWYGPFSVSEGLLSFDDTTYRTLLQAKVVANHWDGTILQMRTALQHILDPYPNTILGIIDNYDMTMDIGLAGRYPPPLIYYLITGNYINFKPEGVDLRTFVTSVETAPLFGLDVESSFISGLDVGAWGVDATTVLLQPSFSITTLNTINGIGSVSISTTSIFNANINITGSTQTFFVNAVTSNVPTSPYYVTGDSTIQINTTTITQIAGAPGGVGNIIVNATALKPATVNTNGRGAAVAIITTGNTILASSTIAGNASAINQIVESASGSVAAQPGQVLLTSPISGSTAAVTGPFDTWKINLSQQPVHNGVVNNALSSIISLNYINHVLYAVSANGNSFGTPGWYSWTGSGWNSVATPINESTDGTLGIFDL